MLISPDGEKVGDVAACGGDQAKEGVLLEDDQVGLGVVVEGLEMAGLPGPALAADKAVPGQFIGWVIRETDWDIEPAEFVRGRLGIKGMGEPADRDGPLRAGVFQVDGRAHRAPV